MPARVGSGDPGHTDGSPLSNFRSVFGDRSWETFARLSKEVQTPKFLDEWRSDRDTALKLKYESATRRSTSMYQGDDKCGSQWVELPVDGRPTKDNAKYVFAFGIQANVIFGEGGLYRLVQLRQVRRSW